MGAKYVIETDLKVNQEGWPPVFIVTICGGSGVIFTREFSYEKNKNAWEKFFQESIDFMDRIPFKDLPLYINSLNSVVRAICLDRLQHE